MLTSFGLVCFFFTNYFFDADFFASFDAFFFEEDVFVPLFFALPFADTFSALFRFGDVIFAVFDFALGFTFAEDARAAIFLFGEDVFDFPSADAFTLPFFFPVSAFLCPFALPVGAATNFSTVQPTLTETTSSPDFTSTTTSPFVAARLRILTSSNLVGFGAPFVR